MTVLFLGDIHGSAAAALRAVDVARERGIKTVIQVGDWDLWGRAKFLAAGCEAAGIHMRFIDGNHDHHAGLHALPPGDHNVARNMTYQHRGSLWVDDAGVRFVFLGGAISPDRHQRDNGRTWSPAEAITPDDVERACAHGTADVLVVHDAPALPPGMRDFREELDRRPWNERTDVKQLPFGMNALQLRAFSNDAEESRAAIALVAGRLGPRTIVHGHYHRSYCIEVGEATVHGLSDRGGLCDSMIIWPGPGQR